MRIAIDISQIAYGTGVSVYTKNLVTNLLKIDRDNDYVLFAGALRRRKEILSYFPQAKVFPIPPTAADLLWNRLHILPVEKLIGKIDVLHTSDWTEPPSNAYKVTTVHDLYPFKFPRVVSPAVREVHKRKLNWVLRESKKIIVPSGSTKSDLVKFGAREELIRVIPEAPSLKKSDEAGVIRAKKKYNLQGNYLITIGVTALKNTKRIIEAFQRARIGTLKLVLVGRPLGVEVGGERNIRILGHVPEEDLSGLLTGSSGLVFASLYEGYGIPILDAFACGVPVVTSNVASMPEVAGDAAVLVDPYDVSSISEGIRSILRGPKGWVEKGNERVKGFSWEKAAQETLKVYNPSI